MTLFSESSKSGPALVSFGAIESLAGVFHPHAIEIQDFPHYSLLIDVRSASEYEDDHIPGAVRLDPPNGSAGPLTSGPGAATPMAHEVSMPVLAPALAAAVAPVRPDQVILVYCGRGGLVSAPVAQVLRRRGWTVDVLLGGWINYRRWVQAGLEVLPRMVQFRVIVSTLGTEGARVLRALRSQGHQVLDLETLAGAQRIALARSSRDQPAQAWFESQLLKALREIDPALPVWVADTGPMLGAITLPGAMNDALAIAPAAEMQAGIAARASAWAEDEALCADADTLIGVVTSLGPTPADELTTRWRDLASHGLPSVLLSSLLGDHLDPIYRQLRTDRASRQRVLPPLVSASLDHDALAKAVSDWLAPAAAHGSRIAT